MPISTPHENYLEYVPLWQQCADANKGAHAVKARGEEYLPRLPGQTDDRYKAYVKRTLFYGATKRTIRAVLGAVFRKDPQRVLPEAIEAYQRDVTLMGMSLSKFERWIMEQLMVKGRGGILVSWSEAERRPYFSGYQAENITYWETIRVGDVWKTGEVRLKETYKVPKKDDPHVKESKTQIRKLYLEPENLTLVVEIWREKELKGNEALSEKEKWEIVDTIYPTRRNVPLDFVPFVPFTAYGIGWDMNEPPFNDLVEANLDHYGLDAIHKSGLVKCGFPQAWFAGFEFPVTDSEDTDDEEGEGLTSKVPIGADYALVSSDPQATAGYLQVDGSGIEAIEREKQKDEERMAALGARVLETQKAGIEAAAAIQMRHSGETVTVSDLVLSGEMAEEQALGYFYWWMSSDDKPDYDDDVIAVQFNRDYVSMAVDSNLMREVLKGVQSGEIDDLTWFNFLEKGELLKDGDTFEDFKARIAESGARLPLSFVPDDDSQ